MCAIIKNNTFFIAERLANACTARKYIGAVSRNLLRDQIPDNGSGIYVYTSCRQPTVCHQSPDKCNKVNGLFQNLKTTGYVLCLDKNGTSSHEAKKQFALLNYLEGHGGSCGLGPAANAPFLHDL